jgi:hypothetical protein
MLAYAPVFDPRGIHKSPSNEEPTPISSHIYKKRAVLIGFPNKRRHPDTKIFLNIILIVVHRYRLTSSHLYNKRIVGKSFAHKRKHLDTSYSLNGILFLVQD